MCSYLPFSERKESAQKYVKPCKYSRPFSGNVKKIPLVHPTNYLENIENTIETSILTEFFRPQEAIRDTIRRKSNCLDERKKREGSEDVRHTEGDRSLHSVPSYHHCACLRQLGSEFLPDKRLHQENLRGKKVRKGKYKFHIEDQSFLRLYGVLYY